MFIKDDSLTIIQLKKDGTLAFKKYEITCRNESTPNWVFFEKCLAVDYRNKEGGKVFSNSSYYVFFIVSEYDPPG